MSEHLSPKSEHSSLDSAHSPTASEHPSLDTESAASPPPLEHHIQAVRSVFSPVGVPCFASTFVVEPRDLVLYYGKPGPIEVSHRLDFADASEDDLRRLAEYCDPASFGRNSEAVFDETYRKAGKLDAEHFSANFDPERCGLLRQLRPLLLEGHGSSVGVRPELYKLNVYGPGSFFKAHKDTPRGQDMFASLVVVLPTAHEGGTLRFKHNEHSFDFDSAQAVADAPAPSIAYAAFFSDIDHEVDVVKAGYRVTLTYNLYYTDESRVPYPVHIKTSIEDQLRQTLQALLDDERVLPNGGLLGFGLRHQYPNGPPTHKLLKGSDAVLAKVCKDLGLKTCTRTIAFGRYDDMEVLVDNFWLPDCLEDQGLDDYLVDECGGLSIESGSREPDVEIHWVTPKRAKNVPLHEEPFATYGNEPAVEMGYWYFCFIVAVHRDGRESADILKVMDGNEDEEDE